MLSLVEANGIDGQPRFRGNLADLQKWIHRITVGPKAYTLVLTPESRFNRSRQLIGFYLF
jgi:hypothetical protein